MNIDTMKTGEELSLIAMKKELKRLSYIAEKNKKMLMMHAMFVLK